MVTGLHWVIGRGSGHRGFKFWREETRSMYSLTYAGDGHVHKVGSMVVVMPRPIVLQSLEEAH